MLLKILLALPGGREHALAVVSRQRGALVSLLQGPRRATTTGTGALSEARIAIARATVGTRRLLLADELTGALDTLAADSVIDLLATLAAERGTAVVLVTHEPRFTACRPRRLPPRRPGGR